MKLFSLFFATAFAVVVSFCAVAQNDTKGTTGSATSPVNPVTATPAVAEEAPKVTPATRAVAPGVSCEKVCVEPGKTAGGVSPKPVTKKVIVRKPAPKPDMEGVVISVGPSGIDRVERGLPGKDIHVFAHSGSSEGAKAKSEPAVVPRTTQIHFYDLRTVATAPVIPVAVAPTVTVPTGATAGGSCRWFHPRNPGVFVEVSGTSLENCRQNLAAEVKAKYGFDTITRN